MQISSMSASAMSLMQAKMFSKIDANSDGGLTLEEMTASAPTGKNGQTESADSIKSRFTSMDTNSDGSVTEEESASFFQSQMSSDTMSGMLQAQEASGGRPPMGPPPSGVGGTGGAGGQEETSFDELDTDQDGTVSLAEMQAGLSTDETESTDESARIAELFSAMDADGDGAVTESEKSTFDEEMRANGPPPPPGMGQGFQTASATSDETDTSDTTSTASASATDTVESDTAAKLAALTSQWMQSMASLLAQREVTSTTSVAA